MSFVIDTSAYSRGAKGDTAILNHMSQAEAMFLPTIVYGELIFGFHKGTKIEQNTASLERFLSEARVQVVPIDEKVAEQYGKLRATQEAAGKPIAPNDLWIAAICVYLQQPLLTTDGGFEHIDQLKLVLDPR